MKRVISAVRWEQTLQWRNGFYYAAIFVAVLTAAFLLGVAIPRLDLVLPALVYFDIVTGTFYFVAGLVLLEKAERVLDGLVVTPMRDTDYLRAKIITLVGLAILEISAVVLSVVLVKNMPLNLAWLLLGTALLGSMYVLIGFVFVSRYDSINEFLFPSIFFTMLFALPILWHFDLVNSALFYLHPMQAPLMLLRAAFMPVEAWQLAYGIGYSLLWVGIFFVLARRAFARFVVMKQGRRHRRAIT